MKTIYSSISKRVFSLLVALIMAISTVPFAAASAFAQEQGISITTSTITPNTKSIEVTLAQGITTGFAKVIQLDSGEEYDTTKLFSYTDLSGVIGYTALNEGSNTITLTTAPTEGKEVIAVLHDRSSGEMQEYTSAPITVTASEGSSGGENNQTDTGGNFGRLRGNNRWFCRRKNYRGCNIPYGKCEAAQQCEKLLHDCCGIPRKYSL